MGRAAATMFQGIVTLSEKDVNESKAAGLLKVLKEMPFAVQQSEHCMASVEWEEADLSSCLELGLFRSVSFFLENGLAFDGFSKIVKLPGHSYLVQFLFKGKRANQMGDEIIALLDCYGDISPLTPNIGFMVNIHETGGSWYTDQWSHYGDTGRPVRVTRTDFNGSLWVNDDDGTNIMEMPELWLKW